MDNLAKGDFCITVDFDKNSKNPERVFVSISEMIVAFKNLDNNLTTSIHSGITPVLMLEDIESGSIKTWLKQGLEQVNDNALMNLDWKPLVGQYLVKAKYFVLDFISQRSSITDASEIKQLQSGLYELAEQTNVNQFPSYAPITLPKLIGNIQEINNSLQKLEGNDKVTFSSNHGDATFNLDFAFVPSEIEDLLTKETIEQDSIMILKIKKPDYLGNSQWDFKYDKRSISAKITHLDWVTRFQRRLVDVRPGDSLKAKVHTAVKYGFDMNVINTSYEVIEVIDIIKDESFPTSLFNDED